MIDTSDLAFYVVQNSEGKFFRRKGYGGSGDTWVEGLGTARIWAKIGAARSQVTYFANHYPSYPPPKIVKLTVTATEVIDETERIAAVREKKSRQKEKREVWVAQQRLKQAQSDLKKAQDDYDREQRKQKGKV